MGINNRFKPSGNDYLDNLKRQPGSPTRILYGLGAQMQPPQGDSGTGTRINYNQVQPTPVNGEVVNSDPLKPKQLPPPQQQAQQQSGFNTGRQTHNNSSYGNTGGWTSQGPAPNSSHTPLGAMMNAASVVRDNQPLTPTSNAQVLPTQNQPADVLRPPTTVNSGSGIGTTTSNLTTSTSGSNDTATDASGNQVSNAPATPEAQTKQYNDWLGQEAYQGNRNTNYDLGSQTGYYSSDNTSTSTGNTYNDLASKTGVDPHQLYALVQAGKSLYYDKDRNEVWAYTPGANGKWENGERISGAQNEAKPSTARTETASGNTQAGTPGGEKSKGELDQAALDAQLAKNASGIRAQSAKDSARAIRAAMEMQAYSGGGADQTAGVVGDISSGSALGAEQNINQQALAIQIKQYESAIETARAAQNFEYAKKLQSQLAEFQAAAIRQQQQYNDQISPSDILGSIFGLGSTALGAYAGRK